MPDPSRSETDRRLSELARGKAERAVLGKNPYGSMIRIVLAVVSFIILAGTIFYFVGRST